MNHKLVTALIAPLFVSACASVITTPDPGMALIVKRQSTGGEIYAAGQIVGITAVSDGKTFSYPDIPSTLQVPPGKYVIRHLCYLSTEGRPNEVIRNRIGLASVEEVSLEAGQVLYVKPDFTTRPLIAPNGTFVGHLPSCTHGLMTVDPDKKQKNSRHL
jgi:hypothetical protein